MRHGVVLGWWMTMVVAVGCGASSNDEDGDGDDTTGAGASATTASGGSGAGDTTSGGVAIGGGFGFGGGDTSTRGCSADLRFVLDEDGTVLEDCWPDQGCAEGACVAPCDAAGSSRGSVGCDFRVATPHFTTVILPPCFAVFVANNWPQTANLTIEQAGQTYDVTQFGRIPDGTNTPASWPAVPATGLPAGEVAVLFLSQDPNSQNLSPLTCPVPPAISQPGGTAVAGSGVGQAWRITSDIPLSAYDILPFGGAASFLPSAELILPTTALDTNYIAVTPTTPNTSGFNQPPWGQVMAVEDDTTITVLPTAALPAAGAVPAGPANQALSFTLGAGEYVQWELGVGVEMSGSVIQSDKPVSFTGGHAYICYSSATSSGGGCDAAHQIIPPLRAQGSRYVAAPHQSRTPNGPESVVYRIVGAVDGTTLTYDPPVATGPAAIGAGEVIDVEVTGAFTVASQDDDHPFYLGQTMSGCQVTGSPGCIGDEEYVNTLPPAQFLRKYVFFTDPSYATTNLVVTRVRGSDGTFSDVTVDCLGTLGGWQPVGSAGEYEITSIDLQRDGVPAPGCANGRQEATSEGTFGITVWGLDSFASYAYPAGGNVATINDVVITPIPK
ncbi:MAG: IgGFc-binding protein [Myxococcota bacterium]